MKKNAVIILQLHRNNWTFYQTDTLNFLSNRYYKIDCF